MLLADKRHFYKDSDFLDFEMKEKTLKVAIGLLSLVWVAMVYQAVVMLIGDAAY